MCIKKILLAAALALPLSIAAQNTWEMAAPNEKGANPDQKYLAGAVTTEKGRVVWKKTIDAPGKTAQQVFDIIRTYLLQMTQEPNQTEQSRVIVDDPEQKHLVGTYQEWLVFKSTALELDRTRLFFALDADCRDGKAEVTMTNIAYLYEEERDPQHLRAEEWITDEYGLNKKQNKLARISGKFRRKTIDRKDYLFNKLESLLK